MDSRARPTHARLAAAVAAAMALLVLAPAAAEAASTVTVGNYTTYKTVFFQAGANKANQVTLTSSTSSVTITDPADTITENVNECTGNGTNTVTCTDAGFGAAPLGATNIDFRLDAAGDAPQNDTFTATGPLTSDVSGFGGNDRLTGSPDAKEVFRAGNGNDIVETRGSPGTFFEIAQGEAGDDQLTGGPTRDGLHGEQGKDTLRGGAGNDTLGGGDGDGDHVDGEDGDDSIYAGQGDGTGDTQRGGPGIDVLSYSPRTQTPFAFSLDLASGTTGALVGAESDSSTEFEDVTTGQGDDQVSGTAGANSITTGQGGDTVDGRAGPDFINTAEGNDVVSARDGSTDQIRCGDGNDSVMADQLDDTPGCENVDRAQVTPVKADERAPRCKLRRLKRRYSRRAFLRGLRPRIDCNERFAATVRVLTRGGDVQLVERKLKLGGDRRVRLRPPKVLRSALSKIKRRQRVTIQLKVRDASRNRRVITKRIQVG